MSVMFITGETYGGEEVTKIEKERRKVEKTRRGIETTRGLSYKSSREIIYFKVVSEKISPRISFREMIYFQVTFEKSLPTYYDFLFMQLQFHFKHRFIS